MPTDEENAATKANKRLRMASTTSGSGLSTLVLPDIPFHPIPPSVARRVPELDKWNRENHAGLMQWRERASAALARQPESTTTTP